MQGACRHLWQHLVRKYFIFKQMLNVKHISQLAGKIPCGIGPIVKTYAACTNGLEISKIVNLFVYSKVVEGLFVAFKFNNHSCDS